jgi:hypothetical protein
MESVEVVVDDPAAIVEGENEQAVPAGSGPPHASEIDVARLPLVGAIVIMAVPFWLPLALMVSDDGLTPTLNIGCDVIVIAEEAEAA